MSVPTPGVGFAMTMSKLGYFAEFLLFPPLVVFATALALHSSKPFQLVIWLIVYATGIGGWTLIEYLVHRVIFHRMPILSSMHERHHQSPRELIGAPAWTSGLGLVGLAIPCWVILGFYLSTAVIAGMVTGYLWYVFVHYAAHHCELGRDSYLYRARLRHARHHYVSDRSNFGVTTNLWDRIFRTTLGAECRSVSPREIRLSERCTRLQHRAD
jgi:sterol desaturase/sphingolipid hydroxylase (fatty acid hydroxylase superfamily)